MIVLYDFLNNKKIFLFNNEVYSKLNMLKHFGTDDHQYNLILFEHVFNHQLMTDVSLLDDYISKARKNLYISLMLESNMYLFLDLANMRINGTEHRWIDTDYNDLISMLLFEYNYHNGIDVHLFITS